LRFKFSELAIDNVAMETEIDFSVVNVSNVQRLRFALLKQQSRQLG